MFRLLLAVLYFAALLAAQTSNSSIQGSVSDSSSHKPIPSALLIAVRIGLPPFSRTTRSGADGAFQIQGLIAGAYSLCAQVAGDQYLDPCQWTGGPATVTLAPGQIVTGLSMKLTPASIVHIQVRDPQKTLSLKTKDGRTPGLSIGVTGPKGLVYPARRLGGPAPQSASDTYSFQLAIPRDTTLILSIASHDLKLSDSNGVALPANASQQAFQHATADPNPKSFAFTISGLLP
jgi:hypothetical protein